MTPDKNMDLNQGTKNPGGVKTQVNTYILSCYLNIFKR